MLTSSLEPAVKSNLVVLADRGTALYVKAARKSVRLLDVMKECQGLADHARTPVFFRDTEQGGEFEFLPRTPFFPKPVTADEAHTLSGGLQRLGTATTGGIFHDPRTGEVLVYDAHSQTGQLYTRSL